MMPARIPEAQVRCFSPCAESVLRQCIHAHKNSADAKMRHDGVTTRRLVSSARRAFSAKAKEDSS
jgi:hypothetical protein